MYADVLGEVQGRQADSGTVGHRVEAAAAA